MRLVAALPALTTGAGQPGVSLTSQPTNLLAVEKKLIRRVLGTLAEEDMREIEKALRAALGLR